MTTTRPENSLAYPAVESNNPFAPINTVVKVQGDMNNFGPRFGFAYNPHEGIFADGKTVFHGGLGAFLRHGLHEHPDQLGSVFAERADG